jgi:hypothetical protein
MVIISSPNNQAACLSVSLTSQPAAYLQMMPDGSRRLPVKDNAIPLSTPGNPCSEIFFETNPLGLYNWSPGTPLQHCLAAHSLLASNDSLFTMRIELVESYDVLLPESLLFESITISNAGELFEAVYTLSAPYHFTMFHLMAQ